MSKLNNTYIYTKGLSPRQLTELYEKYSKASGVESDMEGRYFGASWNFLFIINNALEFSDERELNNSLREITEQDLDNILKESSEYLPEVGEECRWKIGSIGSICTYVGIDSVGSIVVEIDGVFKTYHKHQIVFSKLPSQEEVEREKLYNAVVGSYQEASGLSINSLSLERLKDYSDLMYDKGVRLTTNKENN